MRRDWTLMFDPYGAAKLAQLNSAALPYTGDAPQWRRVSCGWDRMVLAADKGWIDRGNDAGSITVMA
jgi:hypothetical protein